jgi:N-acetylmuramoyl-L-alanine amidase
MGVSHAAIAELRQQVLPRPQVARKRRSRGPKSTTIAAYSGVFLLVMSMVAIGYQPPQKIDDSVASAVDAQPAVLTQASLRQQPSIDQLVATNVAAEIAERASLAVAPNLASLSISLSVENELAQTSTTNVITKPQIVQPTASDRTMRHYTAQAGDTVPLLAQKYGVSADTIKWANNLTSDAIEPGKQLEIPPVDGVLYTVKNGDTVESLATKYNTNAASIVSFNDLELNGLAVGTRVVLPGGSLPNNERPGYVAPRTQTATTTSPSNYRASYGAGFGGDTWRIKVGTPMYAGNGYAYGNCTAYVYDRRVELGLRIDNSLGNANTWASRAAANGYIVNGTPSAGAVIQDRSGYYGHVGIVEEVRSNGDLVISEMNAYVSGGGFNIVSGRIIPAGNVGAYTYIH